MLRNNSNVSFSNPATQHFPLVCVSHCHGDSYNLLAISNFLTECGVPHQIYGDVLHFKISDYLDCATLPNISSDTENADIFIFNYGCTVSWHIGIDVDIKITQDLRQFLHEPLVKPFSDSCKFIIDQETEASFIDMERDTIILQDIDTYLLLAFSYGISQSVKLFQLEASVAETIEENQQLPINLAQSGEISLSRKQLARKMGALFMTRNRVNLSSNIFDIPDFFWRRPKYETYYEMSIKFMDLKQRLSIPDDKLSVIYELYGILSNELQYTHSSRLEWTIIWLIFIEVILTIVTSWHSV